MGNVRDFARDVGAGLLALISAQLPLLARRARRATRAVVAVGDVYALLMARTARAPAVFVGTAKSVYVAPYGPFERARSAARGGASSCATRRPRQRLRAHGVARRSAGQRDRRSLRARAIEPRRVAAARGFDADARAVAGQPRERVRRRAASCSASCAKSRAIVRTRRRALDRAGARSAAFARGWRDDGWSVDEPSDARIAVCAANDGRVVVRAWSGIGGRSRRARRWRSAKPERPTKPPRPPACRWSRFERPRPRRRRGTACVRAACWATRWRSCPATRAAAGVRALLDDPPRRARMGAHRPRADGRGRAARAAIARRDRERPRQAAFASRGRRFAGDVRGDPALSVVHRADRRQRFRASRSFRARVALGARYRATRSLALVAMRLRILPAAALRADAARRCCSGSARPALAALPASIRARLRSSSLIFGLMRALALRHRSVLTQVPGAARAIFWAYLVSARSRRAPRSRWLCCARRRTSTRLQQRARGRERSSCPASWPAICSSCLPVAFALARIARERALRASGMARQLLPVAIALAMTYSRAGWMGLRRRGCVLIAALTRALRARRAIGCAIVARRRVAVAMLALQRASQPERRLHAPLDLAGGAAEWSTAFRSPASGRSDFRGSTPSCGCPTASRARFTRTACT